jgi:uncharacterized protein (DUF58 family)
MTDVQDTLVHDFESPVDVEPHPLMPLRGWLILIVVLVVVGGIFQIRSLLMLTAFLTILVAVSWAWNWYALRGVTYERALSETHAFFGETVDVTIRLANRKLLPLSWLLAYDHWPRRLPLVSGGQLIFYENQSLLINSFSVRWNESVSRRYTLLCNRRGVYAFGPLHVKTGDLFGLFRHKGGHQGLDRLIVYPQILPLKRFGLPPRDLFGEERARLKIFEDPSRTIGVREYVPGDGFRNVHWKATARSQRLQARVYEPTTSHTIVIMLNVSTSEEYWRGADPELLEQTITAAASIANYVAGQRISLGLVVNGTTPHSDQSLRVPPGRSPYQLMRVLESMAAITPFATRSIEQMLLTESPRLPWGATLLLVTAVVSEEMLATLMRLRQAGRRLALVALTAEALPTLEGITTYRIQPYVPGSPVSWLGKRQDSQPPDELILEPVSAFSSVSPRFRGIQ